MKYEVVLKQYPADEDMPNGYWTAICPSLPCCVTDGETRAEALAMIADAIDLWLVDDEPLDATETLRQKAATLLEAQREGIAAETHLVEPQAMTDGRIDGLSPVCQLGYGRRRFPKPCRIIFVIAKPRTCSRLISDWGLFV